MQISSIIDIIDGKLLNSPFVSSINELKTLVNKVHEGDLFIVKNEEDISKAVKNGAYAIVIDFDTLIIDTEIAWIKVDKITNAIKKLVRYKLSNLNLQAIACKNFSYELLHLYKKSNFVFINDLNEDDIFKKVENLNNDTIIISTKKRLLNEIYPENKSLNGKKYKVDNLVEHSLFESSFTSSSRHFSRIKVSSLYINEFLDVYDFLDGELDLNKLRKNNYFKPIFVDKYLSIADYGSSDKFILVQDDYKIVDKEINYIADKFKYAKSLFITKKSINNFKHKIYLLKNLNEIKKFLKKNSFNSIYIAGYKKEEIIQILNEKNEENNLFSF